MTVDRRAQAYSEQFTPIFISRCIDAARANQPELIPNPIRKPVMAFVQGGVPVGPDVTNWTRETLYNHRVSTGSDYPLPPVNTASKSALPGTAAVAATIGFGLAKTLFKLSKF